MTSIEEIALARLAEADRILIREHMSNRSCPTEKFHHYISTLLGGRPVLAHGVIKWVMQP